MTTTNQELEERVSYLFSATKDADGKGDYTDAKTPVEMEDGALTEGGALNLFSREAFGLLAQYGAIGVIYGMIPELKYPIFNNYLAMEGYQVESYDVLVTLGWSFKVFWGMISDCVPIFGYRRKSWMLIGWTLCTICLCIMAFSSMGAPFCDGRKTKFCAKGVAYLKNASNKINYQDILDESAPNRGGKFIILSVIVSVGYVMAACASDAMVVQYAQREPAAIRGRVQTAIYVVRTLTGIIAQLIVAFGLNGAVYSGSFDFAMGPTVPYAICIVPSVLVMLNTIFILVEKKTERTTFTIWWGQFWNLLQNRAMYQICAFRFISNIFWTFGATPAGPISQLWAKVEPLNSSLASVIGNLLFAGILVVVGRWGLAWNWRYGIIAGTLSLLAIDITVIFITIWNVYRDQWFFTGCTKMAEQVPSGIRFMVSGYVAVEVADVGVEGAAFGLLTTVSNLASPFSSILFKYVNSFFDVSRADISRDDTAVKWQVSYCYIISYSCKLLSLVWLFLLPPQKAELQVLKRNSGRSKLAGYIVILVFLFSVSFSMTSNFMSIDPSTKCYRIAGGKGGPLKPDGTCV